MSCFGLLNKAITLHKGCSVLFAQFSETIFELLYPNTYACFHDSVCEIILMVLGLYFINENQNIFEKMFDFYNVAINAGFYMERTEFIF